MSADNYGVVAQHPESGRWYILEGCASSDKFEPNMHWSPWFKNELDALHHAFKEYYEYGVSTQEWPWVWYEQEECPTCGDCTLWARKEKQ